ncbi:MAG: hypothetical protein QOH17_1891 [Pseudonocardiales bacterium]|nr:hypothetical protein [Pseudonocardiales bacterium]
MLSSGEVVETTTEVVRCVECGDELPAERAELGYTYCTKDACQARHHRGLVVTTIGVNKSGDTVVVGDAGEIRKRGEAGELARKDTALGLDYRPLHTGPRRVRRTPPPLPPRRRPARAWTAEQERLVRLYCDMGLNPRQIAERARETAPRLAITESLAVRILSAPRR